MTTQTEWTLKLSLYQSVDGLAVEVSGLPFYDNRPWVNQARQYEVAAEALRRDYPELVIKRSAAVNSDGLIFWVTNR